jgi:hypothetical protein
MRVKGMGVAKDTVKNFPPLLPTFFEGNSEKKQVVRGDFS